MFCCSCWRERAQQHDGERAHTWQQGARGTRRVTRHRPIQTLQRRENCQRRGRVLDWPKTQLWSLCPPYPGASLNTLDQHLSTLGRSGSQGLCEIICYTPNLPSCETAFCLLSVDYFASGLNECLRLLRYSFDFICLIEDKVISRLTVTGCNTKEFEIVE